MAGNRNEQTVLTRPICLVLLVGNACQEMQQLKVSYPTPELNDQRLQLVYDVNEAKDAIDNAERLGFSPRFVADMTVPPPLPSQYTRWGQVLDYLNVQGGNRWLDWVSDGSRIRALASGPADEEVSAMMGRYTSEFEWPEDEQFRRAVRQWLGRPEYWRLEEDDDRKMVLCRDIDPGTGDLRVYVHLGEEGVTARAEADSPLALGGVELWQGAESTIRVPDTERIQIAEPGGASSVWQQLRKTYQGLPQPIAAVVSQAATPWTPPEEPEAFEALIAVPIAKGRGILVTAPPEGEPPNEVVEVDGRKVQTRCEWPDPGQASNRCLVLTIEGDHEQSLFDRAVQSAQWLPTDDESGGWMLRLTLEGAAQQPGGDASPQQLAARIRERLVSHCDEERLHGERLVEVAKEVLARVVGDDEIQSGLEALRQWVMSAAGASVPAPSAAAPIDQQGRSDTSIMLLPLEASERHLTLWLVASPDDIELPKDVVIQLYEDESTKPHRIRPNHVAIAAPVLELTLDNETRSAKAPWEGYFLRGRIEENRRGQRRFAIEAWPLPD